MINLKVSFYLKGAIGCILLLTSFFITTIYAQDDPPDSLKFLQADRLLLAVNGYSSAPNMPSFEEFQQKVTYRQGLASAGTNAMLDPRFQATTNYVGMMVNFLFTSKFLNKKADYNRSFFTAAFESGRSNMNWYEIVVNDSVKLDYDFQSDVFRITFGYRRNFLKKDSRFKLFTGVELVNEFNISGVVFERVIGSSFTSTDGEDFGGERKLFTRKSVNLYLNIPTGISFRLSKHKKSFLFYNINLALGTQNADPFRINGLSTGGRFGIAFGI